MTNQIELPYMRHELIAYLKELADRDYQLREWTGGSGKKFWYSMLFAIHFIMDDLCFGDGGEEAKIGTILVDERELDAMMHLTRVWKHALDKIGMRQPDSAYINSPLWDDVVAAAKQAFDVLYENGGGELSDLPKEDVGD